MKIKKIFIIIMLLIANNTAYGSKEFLVNDINFIGLQHVSINTALQKIKIKKFHIINEEDISNSIHSLFSTGYFDDINVFFDKKILFFKVKERPIIVNISFYGNKTIKNDLLMQELKATGIYIKEFLNYNKIFNFKKKLKEFYYSIGKYNIDIQPIVVLLPYNRVNLKLLFQEGKTSNVQQINIIGNNTFTKDKLISNFNLKAKKSWYDFISDHKYNKEKFFNDLLHLRNYYLDKGYALFNIDSVQFNLTPDKNNIYITINITEGDQYVLSDIKISGNLSDLSTEIKNLTKLKFGKLYNGTSISRLENNIKNLLGHYGYIYPNLQSKFKVNHNLKTINYYIDIDVGNRFYVRKINFEGNNITKDLVLRREIRQMEGTWIDNDLINHDKDRLSRLGYFEKVDIYTQIVPGSPDQVDITYKVKEYNTGSFNFGIGYGTEGGISFKIGIQQDNYLGTGCSLNINSVKNDYQSYSEVSVINPYLTVNGISLGNHLFYNNFKANNSDVSSYINNNYGIISTLGFPVNEDNILYMGLGCVHNNISNMKPQVAMWRYLNSIGECSNTIDDKNNFIVNDYTFNYRWIFNKIDRNFLPKKGTRFDLNGKITLPGSKNEFYKMILDISSYLPIKKSYKWIVLNHIATGYSNGLNGKEPPFYENFYAGGSNAIRGFQSNNIGPKAVYFSGRNHKISNKKYTEEIYKSDDAIGGNAIFIANFELITPTPFFNNDYKNLIRTSFFIDAGSVWDTNWQNSSQMKIKKIIDYSNFKNIRISTGVEFQWISPLGPLTFSYAKPLKQYEGDKIEKFQFNIGKTW